MTTSELVRLHITPLNPEILPLVLGANLSKYAQELSYHTLETFPENNYGFVNIPRSDAQKLIAKLNGAILKGRKMKVEEARQKKRVHTEADPGPEQITEEPRRKSRRRENESKVLEGQELPLGRKVKRGWTEPQSEKAASTKSGGKKKSKTQAPSKYTDKEELLFRTKLPPNRDHLASKKEKKRQKNMKQKGESVVHEFERRTAQPSFLRNTTASRTSTEYVEGTGWVDDHGEVVEKEPANLASRRKTVQKTGGLMIDIPASAGAKFTPATKHSPQETSPLSSRSSVSNTSPTGTVDNQEDPPLEDTSSSGSSSAKEPEEDGLSEAHSQAETGYVSNQALVGQRRHEQSPASKPETPPKVHPLEALFKKPVPPKARESAKPSLELETSFSFFAQDQDESEDELPPMPVTPFTSQELHSRGVRSAAPTPDTAHPSRFSAFASALASTSGDLSGDDDGSNSHDDGGAPDSNHQPPAPKPESEFERRFWQERGANNRAWKASRRAALKDHRQQQNRLRSSRKWK